MKLTLPRTIKDYFFTANKVQGPEHHAVSMALPHLLGMCARKAWARPLIALAVSWVKLQQIVSGDRHSIGYVGSQQQYDDIKKYGRKLWECVQYVKRGPHDGQNRGGTDGSDNRGDNDDNGSNLNGSMARAGVEEGDELEAPQPGDRSVSVKWHSLFEHLLRDIKGMGHPKHFSAQPFEAAHKLIKQDYRLTNRQLATITEQMVQQNRVS